MRTWLLVALLALPALAAPAAATWGECRGGETLASTQVSTYHVIPSRRASMGWDLHTEDNGKEGLQATNWECWNVELGMYVIRKWADTWRGTVTPQTCTPLIPICVL